MLVNCAVYENGRKLADIRREEIHLHLGRPDRFVWVALRDPTDTSTPIEEWLRRWVADELQIDVQSVDPTASVREYGLDSVAAVRLVTELEQVLGIVQPTLSQQLTVLREEHLVSTRREGKNIYYSLASHEALAVIETLYLQFCCRTNPPTKE